MTLIDRTRAKKPAAGNKTGALIAGLVFAATALSPSANASVTPYSVDPIDHDFRAGHPFRVFVDFEKGRTGRATRTDGEDVYIRNRLARILPPNIVLVPRRRDADMAVQAQLVDYTLSFHITDVDRRNKKYKKRYRYTPGQCGVHKRATYTRVTEKGVAVADYQLTVQMRGIGTYNDAVRIHAAESYRYGQDLQALTNCGVVPSNNYPNSTVARLFSQAGGHYRETLAHEIHTENLRNLSGTLARTINARADQFYASLAAHYTVTRSTAPYRADVYDFDDIDPAPRRRGSRERPQWVDGRDW